VRALLVVEASSAGVGRHVIDLSHGLAEHGHEVRVIWAPARSDEKFRQAMKDLETRDGSQLSLSMERGPSKSDLALIGQIRDDAREWRADVIHCHSSKAGAVGRLAAKRAGIPSVYTPHAYFTMSPHLSRKSELIFTFAERYLARVGNLTICVSEFERKHAVEVLQLDPEKIVVIPNGIAGPVVADRDQLRSDLSLAPSDQVIGWVGRMGAQKNPVLMVEAFAVARREDPKLRLVMVGDGELRADTETRAKELGIFEDVRFPGPADGAVMMNAFDAFALSSDYEGFPYVALEANAAGLPIASTKMGAVDEVAIPGKSGFFSPVGDSKGLGQQLLLAVQTGKIHPSYPTLSTMVEAIEAEYRALIRK